MNLHGLNDLVIPVRGWTTGQRNPNRFCGQQPRPSTRERVGLRNPDSRKERKKSPGDGGLASFSWRSIQDSQQTLGRDNLTCPPQAKWVITVRIGSVHQDLLRHANVGKSVSNGNVDSMRRDSRERPANKNRRCVNEVIHKNYAAYLRVT